MIIDEEEFLEHYGTPRHSGRYPWGSGGNEQYQRSMTFLDSINLLKSQGLSEKTIADGKGMTVTELRARASVARSDQTLAKIHMIEKLKAKGLSPRLIAERMSLPGESSVRALLAPGVKERAQNIGNIADMLKSHVDKKGLIDIGSGVETGISTSSTIGVSETKLKAAVSLLKEQGYTVHQVPSPQVVSGKDTKRLVLAPPGTTQRDVFLNRDKIQQIEEFSRDDGRHFSRPLPPIPVDPKRVLVRWKEDGGGEADGVLYVREGAKQLSLGLSRYSQVRVQVGDGHYLKGMAIYKEGLPPGVDIIFNSIKSKHDPKIQGDPLKAMKPLETDNPDYPFGSIVSQIGENMGTKDAKLTSAMNIVRAEGKWADWNKKLSSQVLAKQSPILAKQQLDKTFASRKQSLDEINALTNPAVKKKLLEKAAESFDAAAVHLQAATLSQRDAWHVILPISSISPDHVYAPGYNDGERVVLIRYPHGGTFEIPELTVNNKNREARTLIGKDARDAIGIHHTVAERLSGADFDGDTVLLIPNDHRKIKTTRALEKLKGFDPVGEYGNFDGPKMTKKNLGNEMGQISNLITDMTLRGAPRDHLVRAIKHSMVIIDSEKKGLNYKQSAIDNNIPALKAEYQFGSKAGASTLISKKKQHVWIPERRVRRVSEGGPIDAQGRIQYVDTGKTRVAKDGTVVPKQQKVFKLSLLEDAHAMSSHTTHEKQYADHSNRLKALANEARLTASKTPNVVYSSSAAKTYAKEVASLNSKLLLIKRNRPRERAANQLAEANIKLRRQANPNLDKDQIKRIRFEELDAARIAMDAKVKRVVIDANEWQAIQQGAIAHSKLNEILDKADLDVVKALATPRRETLLTTNDAVRARAMLTNGATRAQVAQQLGVSLSTLDRTLKG